jgi:hypothetical protein
LRLSYFLTIAVVAVILVSLTILILGQFSQNASNYGSQVQYSLSRIPLRYDYSCNENVFGLYLVLTNSGSKVLQNLSLSITNELCVGAILPIPNSLLPGQSLKVYLYSAQQNGTITFSGNQTELAIQF